MSGGKKHRKFCGREASNSKIQGRRNDVNMINMMNMLRLVVTI
jgi:DNA polymerase I-like protein with 3'-5' exonuclease and polymerase domains